MAESDAEVHRAVCEVLSRKSALFSGTVHSLAASPLLPSTPSSLDAGTLVGPYRVTRLIGEGGMGAVYYAGRDDEQFDMPIALKVVRGGAASNPVTMLVTPAYASPEQPRGDPVWSCRAMRQSYEAAMLAQSHRDLGHALRLDGQLVAAQD